MTTEERSHLAKEVFMARREVGNLLTQLNEVVDRVVVIASLLNKAYENAQVPPMEVQ